jgi:hypothetical protein
MFDKTEIFLIFAFLIVAWFLLTLPSPSPDVEKFVGKSDDLDSDQDLSLLETNKSTLLQSPMKYIDTLAFNEMINSIRTIVYQDLLKFQSVCRDMNQVHTDGPEKAADDKQYTLVCLGDMSDLQASILDHIVMYIVDHIKEKYNININPYAMRSDLMLNLHLLDAVIYPIAYSGLYTVHGIQYFTESMLKQQISENLKIRDVLYSTLLRRGIDVTPDNDNHQ